MILAIDIGNTNIVVGCIDDKKTYFIERLSTNRTKTELEYAVDLKNVLDIYHIRKTDIEGCIISSVVPQITNIAKLAAEKILKKDAIVLGPGVKTGLNIMMDNPGQLGADQVADAVAGFLTVILKGESGEAYNIADEASDIMLKDLAKIIADFAGKEVVFELPDETEKAGYSKATKARLDGSKLKKLGWTARYDIKQGLERTMKMLTEISE